VEQAALLLMDFQVAICGPGGALGERSGLSAHTAERGVLDRVATCLRAARGAGLPVLHARVAFDDGYTRRTNRSQRFAGMEANRMLIEGSGDAEFVREAAPVDGETVVNKGCVNPFIGTTLDARLRALGVRELYLGGVATNFVVESAARHAGDSGYSVTVLEDLCASYNQEMHDFAIQTTLPLFASIGASPDLLETLEAATA
jgi:biuret amidohydrolase